MSSHEHIENASKGPDITLVSVVAFDDLWSHKVRCAGISFHVMLCILGQAKIYESDFSIFAKHDVFWLNVAMSDTKGVTMMQSFETLVNHLCSMFFSVGLTLFDALVLGIEELSTSAKLHHKVQIVLIVVGFKVLNDVWMVDLSEQINFVHNVS